MMINFFDIVGEALQIDTQEWRWGVNGLSMLTVAFIFASGTKPLV